MKRVSSLFTIALLLAALSGCEGGGGQAEKPAGKTPEPAPSEGAPQGDIGYKGSDLVIKTRALGQEFVMMPTLVAYSDPYTMPEAFATKVVSFQKNGDGVYLVESTEGKRVTDPYEPAKVLAQFPILEEDGEKIAFDFKEGFKNLIFNGWDGRGKDSPDMVVPVSSSYLEKFESEGGVFSFNHVAQAIDMGISMTFTFNYAFVSNKAEDFPVLGPHMSDLYGFFLSGPMYEPATGKPEFAVNRWDISKPVTFYISSNTPEEYFEAVRDGILAWNGAFGSEAVKAEPAPEGVISGDPRFSVIQWVGFDDAGFAYASWHAHPRTGEVQNAFVVLTSTFAVGGKERAKDILDGLDDASKGKERTRPGIRPAGFDVQRLCDRDWSGQFKEFLKIAASGKVSDEEILRISKLYVKAVVMHEVGHDLGLRHNFYGNIGSEIPLDDDQENYLEVVGGKDPDGALPSSSIMDYLSFRDDIRMHRPGRYDEMAIRWAYGIESDDRAPPLYCTDGDVGRTADCMKFDGGADPALWRGKQIENAIADASRRLAGKYLDGKKRWMDRESLPSAVNRFLSELVGLYLDMGMKVLDIDPLPSVERRGRAAEIVARYLQASDENNDVLLRLVTDDLASRLSSQDADQSAREEILGYLSKVRRSYLPSILGMIARMVSPVVPFIPHGASSRGMYGDEPLSAGLPAGAVIPLAEAVAGVAANHVSVMEPAEPSMLRAQAAQVLVSLDREMASGIKAKAIDRINSNIDALKKELEKAADDQAKQEINDLIEEENAILLILTGGVPSDERPGIP